MTRWKQKGVRPATLSRRRRTFGGWLPLRTQINNYSDLDAPLYTIQVIGTDGRWRDIGDKWRGWLRARQTAYWLGMRGIPTRIVRVVDDLDWAALDGEYAS
jgi:hypothetical protein